MSIWIPPTWAYQNVEIGYRNTPPQYVDGVVEDQPISRPSNVYKAVILDTPMDEIQQLGYGNEFERIITVYLNSNDNDEFASGNYFDNRYEKIDHDVYIIYKPNIFREEFYRVLSFQKRKQIFPHFKLIAKFVSNDVQS